MIRPLFRLLPPLALSLFILNSCSDIKDSPMAGADACSICHDIAPSTGVHKHALNYECGACHPGYNNQTLVINTSLHNNGNKDVAVDSSSINPMLFQGKSNVFSYQAQSCSNIPCHGFGREGSLKTTWAADSSSFTTYSETNNYMQWVNSYSINGTLGCKGCHNTTNHNEDRNCTICHYKTALDSVTLKDSTLHINGKVDFF